MKHLREASAAVRERLSEDSAAEKKMKAFSQDGRSVKDSVTDSDVDPEELKKGIEVEYEHTSDRDTAKRIALDHLAEIPDYYTRLAKMEKQGKKAMGESSLSEARKSKTPRCPQCPRCGETMGFFPSERDPSDGSTKPDRWMCPSWKCGYEREIPKRTTNESFLVPALGGIAGHHLGTHVVAKLLKSDQAKGFIRKHAPVLGGIYGAHYGSSLAAAAEDKVKKGLAHVRSALANRRKKSEKRESTMNDSAKRARQLLREGEGMMVHAATAPQAVQNVPDSENPEKLQQAQERIAARKAANKQALEIVRTIAKKIEKTTPIGDDFKSQLKHAIAVRKAVNTVNLNDALTTYFKSVGITDPQDAGIYENAENRARKLLLGAKAKRLREMTTAGMVSPAGALAIVPPLGSRKKGAKKPVKVPGGMYAVPGGNAGANKR